MVVLVLLMERGDDPRNGTGDDDADNDDEAQQCIVGDKLRVPGIPRSRSFTFGHLGM